MIVFNNRNGRAMVIGGHSPLLVLFCLDAWCVKKVIQLPENVSGVQHIEFIPQLFDAGANKVSVCEKLFCSGTWYKRFRLV
jgi:hypothetical protein